MPAESDDPVRQADKEAMLHTEALVLGLHDPSVWEHYWKRYTDDLKRRIDEHYGIVEAAGDGGDAGPSGGINSP